MTTATYEAIRRAGVYLEQALASLDEAREGELREAGETRERSDVRCTRGDLPGQEAVNAHAETMLCNRALARAQALVTEAYEIIA